MFSVVIVTPDVVGNRMAGPGIRAYHFLWELMKYFPTLLLSKGSPRDEMKDASVLIGQPARGFHRMHPGQKIIYDLFDPVLLELQELYGPHPRLRERLHFAAERWRLDRALKTGDLFICATPQQRELYPSVADRIIEVPFGVEQKAPAVTQRENVILWGGGTWAWLDPQTAVDAVERVNREGIACRLMFMGRSRPIDENWVPYAERLNVLAKCKIAIVLHHETPEARYSIRTRVFDAIAAAVPIVATRGGFAADLIEREQLGIVVPPDDVAAVAAAIRRLLTDDALYGSCVSHLERIRPAFSWDIVTRPLVDAIRRWKHGN